MSKAFDRSDATITVAGSFLIESSGYLIFDGEQSGDVMLFPETTLVFGETNSICNRAFEASRGVSRLVRSQK